MRRSWAAALVVVIGIGASATPGMGQPRQFLALGTSSIGGTYYVIGGGMASIINKANPQLNINAEVTGGAFNNVVLLGQKKIQLGLVTNDEVYMAWHGQGKYKTKVTNVRGVLGGHAIIWQMYTLKRTGIKSVADLKGKRISLGAPGSIGNLIGEIVLGVHGLKMRRDWTPEYLGHGDGPGALKDGKLDAVLIISSTPTSAIIDLTSSHGSDVVFITPDRDKLEALLKEHPYWFESKIPAKTYKGQDQDIANSFGASTILVADEAVDAGAVYAVTKTLLEHNQDLVAVHPIGKEWVAENATRGIQGVLPLHPGAERYLKEKGLIR
jgi:TRAP transporter TAXI family solute receptor